jgi:hypothetical protein
MKNRQGFVSNSSSTSFYIDASKYSCGKVEGVIKRMLDLLSFCENCNPEDIKSVCTIGTENREAVVERIKEHYGFDERKIDVHLPKNIIAVDSVDDNSIPWAVQEFLCEVLGAERQHWG